MMNIRIIDNGSGFGVTVDGLIVAHFASLGSAWYHIRWMYEVASQQFTVGKKEIPVEQWIKQMADNGVWEVER